MEFVVDKTFWHKVCLWPSCIVMLGISVWRVVWVTTYFCVMSGIYVYRRDPIYWFNIRVLPRPEKKIRKLRNKRFTSFKTRAKREQPVTWWNLAAQTCPVIDSSSYAPVLTLPRRTCLHSASIILAVHISCPVIAVFVFRKSFLSFKL
jgi:hypothetical protein